MARWSLETFGNMEWPQNITRQVKYGSNYPYVTVKGTVLGSKFDSYPCRNPTHNETGLFKVKPLYWGFSFIPNLLMFVETIK
jgi:hypothetical protein